MVESRMLYRHQADEARQLAQGAANAQSRRAFEQIARRFEAVVALLSRLDAVELPQTRMRPNL